ncbi:carbonate dehydratase [Roseateles aquatilis]|uniref:carbonic anhydrase n=1 Tax=Roseateles aquatilis TaxID=431061 RepID=A0A246JMI3_9BURK|nr:carbonic anhydrase family protein [Roseateles aquatilis]OWQ93760.1 carbonate dehydratase [Roseateles aquatilis]
MSHPFGRALPAVLSLLALGAGLSLPARAADAPAPARTEASPEQLRDRLADRLKDDSSTLKVTPPPRDVKTANPVDLRARKAAKPAAAASAAKTAIPWSYAGEGAPDRWGQLQPEFRQCAIGTRQSPIDLRDTIKVDQEKIQFDYHASNFSVVDNGHTIQVNVAPGNAIQIMGRRYELAQFHFHRPSEERINGRQYDMVAHLVHKDADGRLAVIAVLLERGQDQALIQTVWNYLPLERGDTYEAPVQIDLTQLLPKDRAYFSYMGSLTVPPCTEGVLWMVFRQPVPVSTQQISVFSRLYPMNARPLQAQSGRLIKESN